MRLSKKIAAIAIAAGVAITATTAYAYWTTTGSGSGSATAASANGVVVLHGIIDVSGHAPYPGGSNPVTFTADNAGATDLYVGTISLLATGGVTVDAGHTACNVADLSMGNVTSNSIVLAGANGQAIAGTGSLVFANSSSNQDACKGAEITLHLQSN